MRIFGTLNTHSVARCAVLPPYWASFGRALAENITFWWVASFGATSEIEWQVRVFWAGWP